MSAWSPSETNRTIDEVKQRSRIDPDFRALALTDPMAALGKVNPRPAPVGAVRFVEESGRSATGMEGEVLVVVLPTPDSDQGLSDMELEDVAGGLDTGSYDPPVGLS